MSGGDMQPPSHGGTDHECAPFLPCCIHCQPDADDTAYCDGKHEQPCSTCRVLAGASR